MKLKGLLFIILFISSSLTVFGQADRKMIREKLESRKVAFITERLNLNTQEAQSFWPLYNEMKDELKEARGNFKRPDPNITDADASTMIDRMFEREKSHLEIKKKYADKMQNVIGAKRTLRFLKLDREFKEKMIRDVREKRGKKGGF